MNSTYTAALVLASSLVSFATIAPAVWADSLDYARARLSAQVLSQEEERRAMATYYAQYPYALQEQMMLRNHYGYFSYTQPGEVIRYEVSK